MAKFTSKYNYQFVNNFFNENKSKLLSSEYIDTTQKLDFICSCGKQSITTFERFHKKPYCKYCGLKMGADKQRFTKGQVAQIFKEQNCIFIDQEYHNSSLQKLDYICYCGTRATITLGNFRAGKRCHRCKSQKLSGKNHYLYREDREKMKEEHLFKKRCYSMISETIKYFDYKKNNRSHIILGYSPEDLEHHIKSHPNWQKVNHKKFTIDHIFPIKAFINNDIYDIKIINSLDNLQPMSLSENVSKSDNYDPEAFKTWLQQKGIQI